METTRKMVQAAGFLVFIAILVLCGLAYIYYGSSYNFPVLLVLIILGISPIGILLLMLGDPIIGIR